MGLSTTSSAGMRGYAMILEMRSLPSVQVRLRMYSMLLLCIRLSTMPEAARPRSGHLLSRLALFFNGSICGT